MQKVNFSKPLELDLSEVKGEWVLIFAHGEKSDIEDPLYKYISSHLNNVSVSSAFFRFPFRVKKDKYQDSDSVLENAFLTIIREIKGRFPKKKIAIAGHSLGAKIAIRASVLFASEGDILPVIALSYPMYPPHRPERLDVSDMMAIFGPILFITGDTGNRNSHDRILSQTSLYANFAEAKKIPGADHEFRVKGRKESKVAIWIANDINKFLLAVK